jgi:hypothetical protein
MGAYRAAAPVLQMSACHGRVSARQLSDLRRHFEAVAALVKDCTELRECIHDGVSQRAARHPVIGFFLRRQQLQVPAFGDHLTTGELNTTMAYIDWLNRLEAPE